ncbi:MAG: putative electron transport protein YccM [Planctomycetota bacterium]
MPASVLPRRFRPLIVHAARVAVVAGLVWLVHAEHRRHVGGIASADLASLPLERVRRHLPAAAAIGGPAERVAGGRDLLDAAGNSVGTILKTSPAGDAAIGFSGPTDLLVVCDAELRVAGMEILASRDTRDHVHAVERDAAFWRSLVGRSLDELAGRHEKPHAVAGSTLTSLAIHEALARRLGGSSEASRFEREPTVADLRLVFPEAVGMVVDPGDAAVIRVLGRDRVPLGWALRTSPAADRIIGYQGPTDAVVGFDTAGRVAGVAVLASFDNEPYVGYVRDDASFRGVYRGMTVDDLAGLAGGSTGIEGVSGATMTSQAVAEGIVRAARDRTDRAAEAGSRSLVGWLTRIEGPQWGGIGVIAVGLVAAFTRLRGGWFGRFALPLVVLAYLGFGAGALVSQAQVWGWAQSGVPRGAVVLLVLSLVAFLLPVTSRRNVYCSHLCAHGAAQQLLVRLAKPRRQPPAWLRPGLHVLPWALLVVAILASLFHWPLSLVDLEPFDAYLPTVAGVAALVIFAASLVASWLSPMAYCRHACPTGALLDHLRLHGRSHLLTWRDGLMLGCLAVAAAVHWWPR